ncbi:hypothetical protein VP01_1216g4 [Puccinia sorghi]|uniref:Uncharacterized protein n=1 Tax=Puccinia sorghi TaxID=27349 RepID=A0A0L6VQ89_9BASI|nr:hypothetical protein VP01_1216g4 [Puccinia sorghi]
MNLQICTCPNCIKKTTTSNTGESISGCWVHPSTCLKHWSRHNLSGPEQNQPTSPLSHQSKEKEPLNDLSIHCMAQHPMRSYKDVRTITKQICLDPEIKPYTCCPKCFSLYEPEYTPTTCPYHRSKKSQVCGKHLVKSIADPLIAQLQHISFAIQRRPAPPKHFVPCLTYHNQQFKSWLHWFLNVPGIKDKLLSWQQHVQSRCNGTVFDIQQSKAWCSFALKNDRKLCCNELRLTFSLYVDWFNPFGNKLAGQQASMGTERIVIAGMIPAPHKPDMTTISHILEPLVDELLLLNTGVFQKTPNFPNGRRISIHLGALIGDIVASHKIAGFASHYATFFCSWCKCQKSNMMDMQLGPSRKRLETRRQARYGTCWLELNRLLYWDPVKHVALGVMHNWYKGVLQHHWRVRWAFEPKLTQHDAHNDQLENVEDSDLDKSSSSCHFQDTALLNIRKVITNIVVPLVEGNQMAFTVCYIPLSLLNFFWDDPTSGPKSGQAKMFLNFSSLVICTSIVSLKGVTNDHCNKFAEAYRLYTETAKDVFQWPKVTPNHHYALHLPDQLQWWGPLPNVSEFSGKHINGMLQKINTNGQIGKMEGTVMREFCKSQRFVSLNPCWSLCEEHLIEVHPDVYVAMFEKLWFEDETLNNYQDGPHGNKETILFQYVTQETLNRMVAYDKGGRTHYGMVTHIYRLPEFGGRILVGVKKTTHLSKVGESWVATLRDLDLQVVQVVSYYELLDPSEVPAVCAYQHLPAWTFRFSSPLMLLHHIPCEISPLIN